MKFTSTVLISVLAAVATTGLTVACSSGAPREESDPAGVGRLELPMESRSGEHVYVLTNVGLSVSPGGNYTSTQAGGEGGASGSEILSVALRPGDYQAYLYSWTLNRKLANGSVEPVDARLRSSSSFGFSIQNDATTTITFEFETDGQIVVIGEGNLRVRTDVVETASVCEPLGAGCPEGTYCAPTELTGKPLACIPHGFLGIGEPCASPSECGPNSTCLSVRGAEPLCTELCTADQFGQACTSGGECTPRGEEYGACMTPRAEGQACLDAPLTLPSWKSVDSVTTEDDCTMYIAAHDGLYAVDLWSGSDSRLFPSTLPLTGIALSPSGRSVATADTTYYSYSPRLVHLMDRETREHSQSSVAVGYYSSIRNLEFRTESSFWLNVGDSSGASVGHASIGDPTYTGEAYVNGSPMLTASANGSIAFAAGGNGTLAALQGSYADTLTLNRTITAIAANSTGSVVYVASSAGLEAFRYSGSYSSLWVLPGNIAGVVYIPERDQLAISKVNGPLELRSVQDGSLVATIDSSARVKQAGSGFGYGHLRASRGGNLLTLNTDQGIRVYPLPSME